jgi:hypothetical protein
MKFMTEVMLSPVFGDNPSNSAWSSIEAMDIGSLIYLVWFMMVLDKDDADHNRSVDFGQANKLFGIVLSSTKKSSWQYVSSLTKQA